MEISRGLAGICFYPALTVSGAASGSIAGAVAHFNPLSSYFQETWVGDPRFAGVAETLLIVASIVRNIDRGPRSPGCRLF